MGVHVNITVLVNALFAEWASMVKPTVLVNAFFAEYRRFRTTAAITAAGSVRYGHQSATTASPTVIFPL